MENYTETTAYKQLKSFLKSSYEVNLDTRNDIKKNLIENYIVDSMESLKKAESRTMKKIDMYFEADSLDKKIILRKLDRINKELGNN